MKGSSSSTIFEGMFESIGEQLAEQLATTRDIVVLFCQAIRRIPRLECWRWSEISDSIVQNGIGSLPIISLSTAFAGIVVTHQIAWHMNKALHDVSMIPGFIGQFILRELGIAVPALLLVSKAGAAITAEIGSMKVTEQIDALKLLGIDPVNYLVYPRFIAAIISSACLTLVAISITLGCSIGVAVLRYHFSLMEFLNALRHFVGPRDLLCALVKGIVFGTVIPIISCAYGFRCKGGAEGVGNATTNSVVTSTIVIISLDLLLTTIFIHFL